VKPPSEFRIGTEHEKTPFTLQGHHPVPYEGTRGIGALLEGMKLLLGWEPIMERGNIIGLYVSPAAAQFRWSRVGNSNCPARRWRRASDPVRVDGASGAGARDRNAPRHRISRARMTPSWSREQIPMMPKGRYKIMTNYMPKVGQYGLDMMYRTCTVQTNLDSPPKPTWSRSCGSRWRCSRWRPRCSPIRHSPKASPTASSRSARRSGATPTMRAQA